jgi:hypothetical protein
MNDHSVVLPAYFALFFPVLFVCLWILVSFLISVIGGWHALTTRFRCDTQPYGDVKTAGPFFYSIYMRLLGHYGNVIRLTAAQDALYLSVLALFRAGHPPLRIPWDEIQFERTSFLWYRFVALRLGTQERDVSATK